jgi:hypothetical protein
VVKRRQAIQTLSASKTALRAATRLVESITVDYNRQDAEDYSRLMATDERR